MSRSRICPQCKTRTAAPFAMLPKDGTAVCDACFKKVAKKSPLPATGGSGLLAYSCGQYLPSAPASGAGRAAATANTVSVRGGSITVKGVTIHGVTVRGVTVGQSRATVTARPRGGSGARR